MSKSQSLTDFFDIINTDDENAKKAENQKNVVEMVNLDMMVPVDYLLRKIDKAVNFTQVYHEHRKK